MARRLAILTTGALLTVSGGLLVAASWQRWHEVCPWGRDDEAPRCLPRQDHRYDFLAPSEPWVPLGSAAELAGVSFVLLAAALLALPWLATPRPHGRALAGLVAVSALAAWAYADAGVATLRSGLVGRPVEVWGGAGSLLLYLLAPFALCLWCSVVAVRVPLQLAAGSLLVLATPPFVVFLYGIGPYDARPWYEAVPGGLTLVAGVCLLLSGAARRLHQPLGTPPAATPPVTPTVTPATAPVPPPG